jgi:Zn finger protein HypA/HybF involved in hydrogenase expression
MYGSNDGLIVGVIISLIILITFFVMANRLRKILNILVFFRDIELRKPENWFQMKCEKCGKEFRVSKALKGTINCPHCRTINKVIPQQQST